MNFKIYYVISMLGLLGLSNKGLSQENFKCGLAPKLEAVYAQYPELKQQQEELLSRSLHHQLGASGDREEVYVIPVVFHVIHENGSENISDAQIYDQMEILNRDFRKQNADTVDIMTEFQAIAADTKIEFKLANLDPFGNCTNGIEHIYSHETNMGDDNSKLNQWPRSRYLNVWVVKSMAGGVAGYAYYPSAVSTGLAYADGIIIRHNYIGSIGTSSTFNSRALTHEIGHYLGLPHVWGSTNEPEVACGDDGIPDTPETAGHLSCILTGTDNCNAGVAENVQNYMEYSYCSRMYTEGQKALMSNTLEDVISSRNHLHSAQNQMTSGTDGTPVLCTPLPDFFASDLLVCEGGSIQFSPSVTRASVDTYSWHFEGGSPENSTDMSPIVTYNTPGIYEVSLTVSNAAGSETKVRTDFVNVRGQYWTLNGFFMEDFENDHFSSDGWIVENPEENESKWKLFDNCGYSGSSCIGINHFKGNLDPILDINYSQRQGGTKDAAITPYYNLSQATSASLNFKYIYATTNSGVFEPDFLNLRVYYRKECTSNWITLTNITPTQMEVSGFVGTSFAPDANDPWTDVFVNLPVGALSNNVCFKFEFTAEDFSNNFFIDDVNISGVLGITDESSSLQQVKIYPNPVANGQEVTVSFESFQSESVSVELIDMVGNVMSSTTVAATKGQNQLAINLTNGLASGIYNVVMKGENARFITKLIIR